MPDREIADPEVALLAEIATTIEGQYSDDFSMWAGSPFGWIKTRPSRQVGAIAEKLVRHWCAARNLIVARSPDSEADMVISSVRVEVKYSSLWTNNGHYKVPADPRPELRLLLLSRCVAVRRPRLVHSEASLDERQASGLGSPARGPKWSGHEAVVVSRRLTPGLAGSVRRHALAGSRSDLGGCPLAPALEFSSRWRPSASGKPPPGALRSAESPVAGRRCGGSCGQRRS